MKDLEDLALELPCSWCDAEPGEWCVTRRTRRPAFMHARRTALVVEAWRWGRRSGEVMVYEAVAQRLEARLRGAYWAQEMPTDPEGIVRWLRRQAAPRG